MSNAVQQQTYAQTRPSKVRWVAVAVILIGVLGVANTSLIISSGIIFGWLIMLLIAGATLGAGFGLLQDEDWAWGAAVILCILSIFVSFAEIIGAVTPYMVM